MIVTNLESSPTRLSLKWSEDTEGLYTKSHKQLVEPAVMDGDTHKRLDLDTRLVGIAIWAMNFGRRGMS